MLLVKFSIATIAVTDPLGGIISLLITHLLEVFPKCYSPNTTLVDSARFGHAKKKFK